MLVKLYTVVAKVFISFFHSFYLCDIVVFNISCDIHSEVALFSTKIIVTKSKRENRKIHTLCHFAQMVWEAEKLN